jgi:hypothetical protein
LAEHGARFAEGAGAFARVFVLAGAVSADFVSTDLSFDVAAVPRGIG